MTDVCATGLFTTALCATVLCATAACTTPANAQFKQMTLAITPVLPTVRIESGVKVLQHDRTAFTRATQLELVGAPVTVIGGANGDPDHDVTNVQDVALLSDGRIATLAGDKYYLFGSDGAFKRTLSARGRGPGEIIGASGNVRLGGDTLLIFDNANRRFSWFTPDKGYVRGTNFVTGGTWKPVVRAGVLPGRDIVTTSVGFADKSGALGKFTREVVELQRITPDGRVQPFASIPDMESTQINVTRRGAPGTETAMVRFSKMAVTAVWDSVVVTGSGDGYVLDVRNTNGTVFARIAVDAPRTPVTRAMKDANIELTLARVRGTSSAERMVFTFEEFEKKERDAPVADSLPPYRWVYVTPNKTLWVLDYITVEANGWSATAFRRDGAILGRLRVRGAGYPLTFGDDRVVIGTQDADGIVTLKVHRIAAVSSRTK